MNGSVPCYTTRTGLRIGSMYDPPPTSYMTQEAELVQRAYLTPGSRFPISADRVLYVGSLVAGLLALTLLVGGCAMVMPLPGSGAVVCAPTGCTKVTP